MNMTGKSGIVGKNTVIAHLAVMSHMNIDHQEITAADPGYRTAFLSSPVQGAMLANHIVITYFQKGSFSAVLLILTVLAESSKLKNPVPLSDFGRPPENTVGRNPGISTDLNFRTNPGPGTDLNPRTNHRILTDNGSWMNNGTLINHGNLLN
jgi:hypothetical protein